MNIELIQAAQDAAEAIDWLLKNIQLNAPHLSGKAMGNAEKCASALRTAIQQAEAKVNEPVNPTHWRAVLSEPQRPHELRKHLHTVLFREWDDAESWVASKLDFEGWQYTLEPLYTHPAPGVPDGCVTVKRNVIESALQHVPYRGETWSALNSATASACNIPGMAKTTCPYCEQGFSFEYTK